MPSSSYTHQTNSPQGGAISLCVWPGSLDFKMGLSYFSNSRSEAEVSKKQQPENSTHSRRGLKGITGYGKRMVRSAAAILQQRHGRRNLTFGTLTLPSLSREQLLVVAKNWAQLKHRWSEALSRLLHRKGLDPCSVDVTEIQPRRWKQRRELGLHIHYLHQGKHPGQHWAIAPSEIEAIWQRLLENLLGFAVDCSKATRVEGVKLSAANYLGKYMSKGCAVVKKVTKANLGDYLPSAWWGVSLALRREVSAGLVNLSSQTGKNLLDNLEALKQLGVLRWYRLLVKEIWFDDIDGPVEALLGVAGQLSSLAGLRYLKGEYSLNDFENYIYSDDFELDAA